MNESRVLRVALLSIAFLAFGLVGSAQAQVLLDDTSAEFQWQAAAGNVEFYEVYVSRSSRKGDYELEQTVSAPSTSAIIQAGIGEVARIRVRAGNALGFGPMSPPSDPVRFGLPPELPPVGTPGVIPGRAAGSDNGLLFYRDPDTSIVWQFSMLDADNVSSQLGQEADPNWSIATSGDFDGDGAADLLWQHTSGATRIWYLDPDGFQVEGGPTSPGLGWNAESTGDLDGNGQDDVFWRGPGGPTAAWLRSGTDWSTTWFPPVPDDVFELLAIGDFDGDGLDDLFWRDMSNTDTLIWFIASDGQNGIYAQVEVSEKQPLLWEVSESYDHDGDGNEDINWRLRKSPNVSRWWYLSAEGVRTDD